MRGFNTKFEGKLVTAPHYHRDGLMIDEYMKRIREELGLVDIEALPQTISIL